MGPGHLIGDQSRSFETMETTESRPVVHLYPRGHRERSVDESRVILLPEGTTPSRRVVMGKEFSGSEAYRRPGRSQSSSRGTFKRPKIRLSKRKEKSSSTSSSSSKSQGAHSDDSEGEDLYPEEHQTKYIARKCPGLLFRHGIKQARSQILALQKKSTGSKDPEPVFLRYHRQVFAQQSSSPPLRREHLTISTVVDHLIRGDILKAGDVLVQRMKALEQIAQGAPPHLSMKLEVIPADQVSMVSQEEARTAASEHARELKLQRNWKGKGKNPQIPSSPSWGMGTGKGKTEKGGKSKYQKGDRQDRGNKGEQVNKSAVIIPT